MTYDKDIRVCRRTMMVIGLLQIPFGVIGVMQHNWLVAFVSLSWLWACFMVRRVLNVHQKTRDGQRLITSTLDGRLAEQIEKGTWRPRTGPLIPLHQDAFQLSTPPLKPDDAAVDAMDKAYGYRSYTCPKCGRLSHLPLEVEPYCVECLAEFEKSDWRG